MNRKLVVFGAVILSALVLLLGACSGTATPTSTPTSTSTSTGQQPVDVVSVSGPLPPINPGGPSVEVTLKNTSSEPVIALTASLGITRAGPSNTPFSFNFDVTSSNPLLPSNSISSRLTLIGGSIADNVAYPLKIEGKLKSGAIFSYTDQVQIRSTVVPNPGPWPGVTVYRDSNSPIKVRVNETFSIVLPPAPLFGWGWQNQDLSAFSLLETKTIPGPGNEPDTYGPDAFLFKALEAGAFRITLYIPSKPPQQTESFDIVVNP